MSAPGSDLALAVDIGGSKAAFALVDVRGEPLSPITSHPVPFVEGVADPRALIEIMRPYVDLARRTPGTLRGIGLSVCGNIDLESGLAYLVPNLHWRQLPFGRMVVDAFGLPLFPATDVRDAVLAEVLWGAARGKRYVAWVTIGTGYGGYLFLDGRLYTGAHTFAGNLGHNTWDEANGYLCGCGRRGCVETFVAGPAIARAGQAAADSGRSPLLRELAAGAPVTPAQVFQAEAAGDPAACEIIAEEIRLVAISLGGLVNTLDLEMIVLGGGVAHGSPDFVERVSRRIRDFLMTEEAQRELEVVPETFPNSALFGAAADVFWRSGLLATE